MKIEFLVVVPGARAGRHKIPGVGEVDPDFPAAQLVDIGDTARHLARKSIDAVDADRIARAQFGEHGFANRPLGETAKAGIAFVAPDTGQLLDPLPRHHFAAELHLLIE